LGGWLAYTHFHGRHPIAEQSTPSRPGDHRRSVAVLGFRNLAGRSDAVWLSIALAEMLTTETVAGEKLRLISGDIARTKLELSLPDTDSLSRATLLRLHQIPDSEKRFSENPKCSENGKLLILNQRRGQWPCRRVPVQIANRRALPVPSSLRH
jgi:hypothetical protein